MHNPDEGSFELFETMAEAQERQAEVMADKPPEMEKHYRIFSKGERVNVEGIPMIVKNITTEMLILRPLRKSET